MEHTTLLTTVHGSRLYGLNHAASDEDTYTVFLGGSKKFAKQSLSGKDDEFRVNLHKFLQMCDAGVPQALEAMFSPFAEMHPSYRPFFQSYQMGAAPAQDRYFRTVYSFGTEKMEDGTLRARDDFKRKRHALRLTYNLSDGLRYGRFNPHLSDERIRNLNAAAEQEGPEYLNTLEDMLFAAMRGRL